MNDPTKLIEAAAELVKEGLKFLLPAPPPDCQENDSKTEEPANN